MSAAAAAPVELPSAAGLALLAGELALSGSGRRSDAATEPLLAAAAASGAGGRKRRGGHRRAVHRGLRGP